nr:polymorphic toxin-type HINT domain-containing protein [Kibdelosporangium sp. MJ126-NF4]
MSWPAAGTAEVDFAAARRADQAGSLPVRLRDPSGPEKVRVTVADQGLGRRAGVTGVLVALDLDAGKPGPATVSVDYSSFRYAVGADFGSRLRLVRMPACAVTTPEVPDCQRQTPLPSRNDASAQTVTAAVPLEKQTVVAAVGGPSGSQGTFEASSLSPSGTWSTTGNTGSFTWSYPITAPSTASGGASVALSYDSASVDGRTAGTNSQPSWVGQGWEYSPGFIERTYRACSTDESLPKPQQTDDLCWAGQIVTMNLAGQSTPLVFDAVTGWHTGSESGARIQLVDDPGNGAYRGEYWKITTTDGTSYYFGRNKGPGHTDQQVTNSAWTVPVYGPKVGNPCYNATGFDKSTCTQAWRWNLDFVEDPLGNMTAYYYDKEIGFYGRNKDTTSVEYTRGGVLRRIDYGIRKNKGSMYGQTVPGQVLFDVTERCTPNGAITCAPEQFKRENAVHWPDTPVDMDCKKDAKCENHSPTFWSTKRLSTITTQYNVGAGPVKVDVYRLTQSFPNVGDPELRLDKIERTGFGKDGKQIVLPPVEFTSQLYANRVAGYNNHPQLPHWRLTNIATETGSSINVKYSEVECTATNVPNDQSTVTKRCFPVYWGLDLNNPDLVLDYFHKYVVEQVEHQDRNAVSPTQTTTYRYVGDPAWHFDDNEIVKPKNRTYGQFRGYGQVEVRTGKAPEKTTLTRTTYYRGMNDDVMPKGAKRSAEVPNSLGEKVPDNDNFAGSVREVQTFDGDKMVSSSITDMKVLKTTATRKRDGMNALTADMVAAERSRDFTALAAGGTRGTRTVNEYDDAGRLRATTSSGDGVADVCTTTKYADNTDSWIRDRVKETITSLQACPAVGDKQSPIVAATQTYYDGQDKLGVITGAGLSTRTDTATANANGSLRYETTAKVVYDASGRPTQATNAAGNTATTAYTPVDGGIVSKVVTTNPLGQSSTIEFEPSRGKPLVAVDEGKHRTEGKYDELGRLTAVWRPGRKPGSDPNTKYTYQLRSDGPSAITTQTLVDIGATTSAYLTSIDLFDGLGQLRQTQADDTSKPAGVANRVVKDLFYDSHGWKVRANTRYVTDGPPTATLISVADDAVDARTISSFDGAGRPTAVTSYKGLVATSESRTVYGGDRVTTIPPQGGVTSTTVSDVRGNNTSLLSYTAPPTITGNVVSGGTPQTNTYKYNAQGQLERMTDAAGNAWTYGYDFLGRQDRSKDPDSGARGSTYDLAGRLTSVEDARGQVLSYEYDKLDRRIAEYSGKKEDNKKLASWTYDTSPGGVGKPAYSTRHTPQGDYVAGIKSYDSDGNPAVQVIGIPQSETGFAGTYETTLTYTTTGLMKSASKEARGGLPAEVINMDYDRFGNAKSTAGYNTYVFDSLYTPFREASQYTLGVNNSTGWLTYDRDAQTRRITKANLSVKQASAAQIDDLQYSYDQFGNLKKIANTQGQLDAAGRIRTQCFNYDSLTRLSEAWTATDNCAAAPSTTNVGGSKPYWTSWTFDATGLRKSQVKHGLSGTADTTTAYTYPTPGENVVRPHAVQSSTTGGLTTSYEYDSSGSTKARKLPGDTQSLEWNEYNRLAKMTTPAGETSYVYDADGNQLLRRDPGKNTLFLPGEELARDTKTGAVVGTRYYEHNGTVVALRVGGGVPQYLQADQHGTNQVSVSSVGFAVTRRELDPYGNPIGSTDGGNWPDSHGFLDKPYNEITGLSDIGARNYDPVIGRFISVDPLIDLASPQQWAGYSYANNNPTTLSDPSGLAPCGARPCEPSPPSNPCGARPCEPPPKGNPCGARPCDPPPKKNPCGARPCEQPSQVNNTKTTKYPDRTPKEHTNLHQDPKRRKTILRQNFDRLRDSQQTNYEEFQEFRSAFCAEYPDETGCVPTDRTGVLLDIMGFVHPAFDVASMIRDAVRGDWDSVANDAIGLVPGVGDAFKVANNGRKLCSFSGETHVVMADGSTKPISEVEVGDQVLATDPETGEKGARTVTATIVHEDTLRDLVTENGSKVTTTEDHPFWNDTDRQWQRADQLDPGDRLLTATGASVRVSGLPIVTAHVGTAYNLTVDGLHTFYVSVGTDSALVHNTCPAFREGRNYDDMVTLSNGKDYLIGASNTRVEGDTLILDNVYVFPDSMDGTLEEGRKALGDGGGGEILGLIRNRYGAQAASQGYSRLQINFERVTGNPGHRNSLTFKVK